MCLSACASLAATSPAQPFLYLRARAQADPNAALQLGYLAGAVRTGARHATAGIAAQLARRIEQLATLRPGASAAASAALARGLRAGEASG